MMSRIELCVDYEALTHNFTVIKHIVGDSAVMPMVKANAYGHGLVEVAKQLSEADAFGVATLSEAICLRKSGITQSIFVMCGFRHPNELSLFESYNLTAVIHHLDQIIWLKQSSLNSPIAVWLKIDTGMHRLGIEIDDFTFAYEQLTISRHVKQPFGLMTHFANANADLEFTRQQSQRFFELTHGLTNPKSMANSAAIMNFKESHQQLVRPGIMLYGISPFADKTGVELGLRSAMTLTSHLVSYKQIAAGSHVGYGCTWTAPHDLTIGIVSCGYGDGYPHHAVNGTPILIDGTICPVVGAVSMDMLAVDISAITNPSIGLPVTLWGDGLPIESVAAWSDTIAYELLCQLTDRVVKKTELSASVSI